ncbi:sigma-54-dependent transcriptional regulator [Ovoidimarina sediminis]|uniref:sigma-54-dependent transcriptional regulator n=1 Tax=Ovoidimarina sediminis TaxID=3079856 RepID=UPI0029152AC6|nr:sigma-54 dependent transcriptional regulator [Rhodophyticola sp. MJ-SS7]MDU8942240.1 sigma-54 dependent transcriptional regulator [Rhodophyticola sp. MJ-SS7]
MILFVDDEEHLRLAAEQTLTLADLPARIFAEPEAALGEVERHLDAVLVTDIRMPGMDGLTLMSRVLEIDPEFPVILVTGHGDVDLAVQSMRDGAYDFLEKPYAPARLVETCRRAIDKRRLTLENRALRRQVGGRDVVEARLIGRSPQMVALRQSLRAVAETEADVLIVGRTGTGKEIAARALHRASPRSERPFVAINCAALPEAMIETELFGHEAGAFPGASRARFGRFEHARGGTVFLDEIDSLPLPLQGKLLHAIQDRAITRLGSNDPVPLDIRFIAASKRDLVEASEAGEFRSDLAYRLNVVTLRMPALSERREDIPRLFMHLVNEAAARYKRPAPEVPGAVLASLAARDWPGNVRELRNAADRYSLGLPLESKGTEAIPDTGLAQTLAEQVANHERALIAAAIEANGGSLKSTYESLGLSRKALYEKMRKYGLTRDMAEDAE